MCLVLLNHQTLVSFNTCPTVASLVDCQNASKCNLQEHWYNKTSTNTGPGITKKAAQHSTTGTNCLFGMKNAKNFFIESMNKNPHLCNSSGLQTYSKWWNWQDLTQKASLSFRFSPPKLWFQTVCRYQNTQGAQKTQSVIQVRYPGKKQPKSQPTPTPQIWVARVHQCTKVRSAATQNIPDPWMAQRQAHDQMHSACLLSQAQDSPLPHTYLSPAQKKIPTVHIPPTMLNSQTSSDFRKHSRSICKKDGRCSLAMVVIVASAKIPRKPSLRVVILLHSCFFFYTVSFISFFLWPWCLPPKGRARNQRSRQLCGEREREREKTQRCVQVVPCREF